MLTSSEDSIRTIIRDIVEVLHLTGVIGVNVAPTEPFHWFYKEGKKIARPSITNTSKVRIHPMLHSALGVNSDWTEGVARYAKRV